ncbi:MAG: hypothetical protein R2822_22665 [Spirosomataceae bacterium]
MPLLHSFRVGGTGISGTAFADDASGSFPEQYKNVAFLANPINLEFNQRCSDSASSRRKYYGQTPT